jgi:hypothetical protein
VLNMKCANFVLPICSRDTLYQLLYIYIHDSTGFSVPGLLQRNYRAGLSFVLYQQCFG